VDAASKTSTEGDAMNLASRRPAALGRITITELAKPSQSQVDLQDSQRPFPKWRYTWRPTTTIERKLPARLSQSFDCYIGRDRVRRFTPSCPLPAFLVEADLTGSVLLAHRLALDPAQRLCRHQMRLIFQLAPYLREHFSRSFKREEDLYLPRAVRTGERHVLPDNLGKDSQGRGKPWGPAELLARGRERALQSGLTESNEQARIQFGLLEAAELDPLDVDQLSEADTLMIVRLGLFDLGPAQEPIDEMQVQRVWSRLVDALDRHLGDDTETFNRWFFGNVDNLVHQIAKKRHPGGPIDREVVRQALLELVFRAYKYYGDAVHELMADFSTALPKRLSGNEKIYFNALYQRQPAFGGLPLVLLRDRFEFLRASILGILDVPNDARRRGVLLRLLHYYGQMVINKREGDRRYKQLRKHRNASNRTAHFESLTEKHERAAKPRVDLFAEIAAVLREQRGTRCGCGKTSEWQAKLVTEQTTADKIVLRNTCGQSGHPETVFSVTPKRYKEIGDRWVARDGGDR
jgi:hypothetical protein